MRIGFDAKRAFLNSTGLGNYSRNLIQGLTKNYSSNEYFLYTPENDARFNVDGKNVFLRTPVHYFHKFLSAHWRSVHLSRLIKQDHLDIYHGLSHELPYRLEKNAAKTVVTIHDLIFLKFPEWYPWMDRVLYRTKIKHSCESADKIIAISQQTRSDLQELLSVEKEKIEVIYQNPHPRFQKKASKSEWERVRKEYAIPEKFILSVGTLEARKNVLTLLEAVNVLRSRLDTFVILIGQGSSGYRSKVEEYVERKMKGRAVVLDNVDDSDLPLFYQNAEVFVYPSLYEGFGLPITEALLSGVPVISSMGGCFQEAGGPGSVYADTKDVEALAASLESVLTNSALREQMISTGNQYASQMSEEACAARYHELYKGLLSKGG